MEMNEKGPECDAEHLMEAEAIKKDPVRFAAAKKLLESKKKDIESIQDLKDKAKEMDEEDLEEEKEDLMTEEDKATEQYVKDVEERDGDPYKEAKKETKVVKKY